MKWHGKIGYRELVNTEPGVWEEHIVEKDKKGDLLVVKSSLQTGDGINDNIKITNKLTIVADPYASLNMYNMLYVTIKETKWKVSDVTVVYPRLELTLGGVYNEG